MKLTVAQKMLRPVLNYLVERFFPEGAFFGKDYLRTLQSSEEFTEKWGSVEMACAMFLVSRVRDMNATNAVFEANDITDEGTPVGSWRLTAEKME